MKALKIKWQALYNRGDNGAHLLGWATRQDDFHTFFLTKKIDAVQQ
jgi:hypothetical protein